MSLRHPVARDLYKSEICRFDKNTILQKKSFPEVTYGRVTICTCMFTGMCVHLRGRCAQIHTCMGILK